MRSTSDFGAHRRRLNGQVGFSCDATPTGRPGKGTGPGKLPDRGVGSRPPSRPKEEWRTVRAGELGQTLAALLDWIVNAHLGELLEAGLTHADVFKLVRVGDDYRKEEFGPETPATIHDLAGKLDTVVLKQAFN